MPPEQSDTVAALVEVWKKVVDTQQHFNTLQSELRKSGVTVVTGAIAVAGIAFKEKAIFLGFVVILCSLLVWGAFWAMDSLGYHRYLQGSVAAGTKLEKALRDKGVEVELGTSITAASHQVPCKWLLGSSTRRVRAFYLVIAFGQVLLGFMFLYAMRIQTSPEAPQKSEPPNVVVNPGPLSPPASTSRVPRPLSSNE